MSAGNERDQVPREVGTSPSLQGLSIQTLETYQPDRPARRSSITFPKLTTVVDLPFHRSSQQQGTKPPLQRTAEAARSLTHKQHSSLQTSSSQRPGTSAHSRGQVTFVPAAGASQEQMLGQDRKPSRCSRRSPSSCGPQARSNSACDVSTSPPGTSPAAGRGDESGGQQAAGRRKSVMTRSSVMARGSMALRASVMGMLGTTEQLARKIQENTPTLIPPSDRPAILQLLEQPPGQRGGAKELAPVLRVLAKVPFLGQLDVAALVEIARWVRYQFMEPSEVVFSAGDAGAQFYIVASGRCTVELPGQASKQPAELRGGQAPTGASPAASADGSKPAGAPQPLGQASNSMPEILLEAGQTFGDKALAKGGPGRRSATVTTLTECELLTLDINQYNALLGKLLEDELLARVEVLRRFDLTAGWTNQQLREVASALTTRKFAGDRVVVHQGSPATSLFFVKAGEVRVVRHMPSNARVRRLLGNSVMAAQFQPDSRLRDRLKDTDLTGTHPGGSSGQDRPRDDLLPHLLPYDEAHEGPEDVYVEIATLGPNEIFGEVGAPEGEWRHASIITTTYTELLELTRHDLLTRLRGTCRVALEALTEQYPTDEALLDSLAQNIEWQRYKHRLVAGALLPDHLGKLVHYHRQHQHLLQQPLFKTRG